MSQSSVVELRRIVSSSKSPVSSARVANACDGYIQSDYLVARDDGFCADDAVKEIFARVVAEAL
jgi:hypothetical protein